MRSLIALLLASIAGCAQADPYAAAKALMSAQCASCHTIPGVAGAFGDMGPSLRGIAGRKLIAGKLPNTSANMVRWLIHPQGVLPGTAMPELGLTRPQAKSIADYLATLDGK